MPQSKGHYVAMAQDNAALLMGSAEEGIKPFTFYLRNVLNVLKNKEISCSWEPLETDRWQITPLTRLYEIQPETLIELQPPESGWFLVEPEDLSSGERFDPDTDEPISIGRGRGADKIELQDGDIRKSHNNVWEIHLPDIDIDGKPVSWSGYNLTLTELVNPLDCENHEFSFHGNRISSRKENGNWRFWLAADFEPEQQLEVNGTKCNYKVVKRFDVTSFKKQFPDSRIFGNKWKVCNKNMPAFSCTRVRDVTEIEMKDLCLQELVSDGIVLSNNEWTLFQEGNKLYISPVKETHLINIPKQLKHINWSEWLFSCKYQEAKEKWIQLLEPVDSDEENCSGSKLDYFFDDNVMLHDSKTGRFDKKCQLHILKSRPDEKQLLLSYEPKPKGKPALPRNSQIHVKVDTKQTFNQRESLFKLSDYPVPENLPLIELFKAREEQHWEIFEPADIDEWHVLKDESFDGCDKQREFVSKALATPDFAILDGPPGTGKTTTILELILQLTKRGKRILLAASTHAAINNVLERLQENDYTEMVHATRIGSEDRAVGLEDFVFDNQVEIWKDLLGVEEKAARQLTIDSSNLICGTTMGLHGLLRDQDLKIGLNGPPFDVMIIDECSKTTFQEFIVPAMLAKRWILVGDIRQLSPFTDREQITANLDNLILSPKDNITLSSDLQEACRLLQMLSPYKDRLIVPTSSGVIKELVNEINVRKSNKDYDKSQDLTRLLVVENKEQLISDPQILYEFPVIIIEQSLMQKYRQWMPKDAVILEDRWLETMHAAQHFANSKWNANNDYRYKRQLISDSEDVYRFAYSDISKKKWSDELCWRLEREYWLRFAGNPDKEKWLKRDLDQLFPWSENIRGRVYTIVNIAFPSILESLSDNGMTKRKNDTASTINRGFHKNERSCRHTTLTFQHRMHPDISSVPRELFYASERGGKARSLLDGSYVKEKREWSYHRYPEHRVWLDVKGWVKDNGNDAEAKLISQEIESFCKWARKNPKQDGPYWEVAVLTFYKGQERCLRGHLRDLTEQNTSYSRFEKDGVKIKLATVDFFQGQEADIVFLSMVNTTRDGFLDSPNRLNVAITRARYQLAIVGHRDYFVSRSRTYELKTLAKKTEKSDPHDH